jgi:hypothetical protein
MDITSWPKKWNDASLKQIATLPEFSRSRPWPMLGMLAVGMVAGAAIGGYLASRQSSQMKRLASYAHRMGDELDAMGTVETVRPAAVVSSSRSNHGRKAAAEV